MARTIDQTERRRVLSEAVWRVIVREGLDRASVRHVAAEAGLSTGSLRHFFSTQQELHVFAMQALADRVKDRIDAASRTRDLDRRIVTMVHELLPLTDRTASEFQIWMEFVLRAGHIPAFQPVADQAFTAIRGLLLRIVEGQVEVGLIPGNIDVKATVQRLHATLDGLTFQLLSTPRLISRRTAKAMVAQALGDPVLRQGGPSVGSEGQLGC